MTLNDSERFTPLAGSLGLPGVEAGLEANKSAHLQAPIVLNYLYRTF